ncbi:MAG TPA: hypothetical protein VHF24_09630 [Acidimicrobiales bacterium]|nr:hypothetical protein [Acidimicrobiales bacterium]
MGFYRCAEEEGLIEHSPGAHVRRPRVDVESHAVGLDRNELGALLVAAGLGGTRDHALVSLLALNGLRISEALGADIEDLDLERFPPRRDAPLPAGYTHLGHSAEVLESAIEKLHDVGPTGITALRGALDERGLAFHF